MAAAVHPIRSLDAGEVREGEVRIWWSGQTSHLLRGLGATVFVDPFTMNLPKRLVPPQLTVEDLGALDVLAVTHEHSDHYDPDFLVAALERFPEAVAVLPAPLAETFRDRAPDPDRVLGAEPGTPVTIGTVTLHPIPALHGVNVTDAYTTGRESSGGRVRYVGYVVELPGVCVYHAGDTLVFDEQLDALAEHAIDVALLPINGRDHFREAANLVGNMDAREAAQLADQLGVDLLIPTHYDMFPNNLGYPGHLVDVVNQRHPSVAVAVLSRERPFTYRAPERP